jgi:hypothetical protein
MNTEAYFEGYLAKEAELPSLKKKPSKKSYLLAAALGAGGGGLAGAAVGTGVRGKNIIEYYRKHPSELNEALSKIEESDELARFSKWQKKSPLMRPLRQTLGRLVTNVKEPWMYQSDEMIDRLKNLGPSGILKTILKDRIVYPTDDTGSRNVNVLAREPLYRDYFDLPSRLDASGMGIEPGPESMYVKDPDDPKKWRFNPDTPRGQKFREDVQSAADSHLSGYTKGGPSHNVLGGFAIHKKPDGGLFVADPWDFSTRVSDKDRPGHTGYESLKAEDKAWEDPKFKHREKRIHHLRNIVDKIIGNPVTVYQDLESTKDDGQTS